MRHQTLIELDSLIRQCLTKMTNDAYASDNKISFKLEWFKGTGTIQSPLGENINKYYTLKFYFIDKNQSVVGEEVILSELYYPIKLDNTSEKQEEIALKEFVLNSTRCMYNILYNAIWVNRDKEFIRPKDITDKDIIVDDLKQSVNAPKSIIETLAESINNRITPKFKA